MKLHGRCLAAAAVSVVAGAAATSAAALPANARITTAGLGAIKIGMTERQVEKAAHRRITRQGGASADCTTASLSSKTWLLFTGARLARITVESSRYATRSGVRVGDREAEVLSTYPGDIVREPHAYSAGWFYLKLAGGNRKVVFETDGRRVHSITTGRTPEVDYVEGCA